MVQALLAAGASTYLPKRMPHPGHSQGGEAQGVPASDVLLKAGPQYMIFYILHSGSQCHWERLGEARKNICCGPTSIWHVDLGM
jgi:hypothetical protein